LSALRISETISVAVGLNNNWITTGSFDNGLVENKNGTWNFFSGGDGLACEYNPYATEPLMHCCNNGYDMYHRDINGNFTFSDLDGVWPWLSKVDNAGTLWWSGYANTIYRTKLNSSIDQFEIRSSPEDYISAIGICLTNPNRLYCAFGEPTYNSSSAFKFYRTDNAQDAIPTFFDIGIGSNLPLRHRAISDIAVDANNSNEVWVCLGERFDDVTINGKGLRLYYSSNGGNSFSPLKPLYYCDNTTVMPWPINKIIIDEATGGMYAGTEIGVYYNPNPKDVNSDWVLYNKDLPVVRISDMDINYCTRKLYVSTYGRGLYKCELAEPAENNQTITATNFLNVPTGETRIFNSNITIPSGATMTVNGLVRMATDRTITVQPGARLIVDSGTITSTCDLPWGGVIVEGNPSLSQIPYSNQGYVRMTNSATISNAWNSIRLIGINANGSLHWGKVGGIIQSTNSQFKNNWRDVEFMEYHNIYNGRELPNVSKFITTRFTTDADNKIPNNTLWPHVTMWNVYMPRFEGCVFEDTRNLVSKWQGRTGIYTGSSSYKVGSYCSPMQFPCTGSTGIRSEFNNLGSAIESYDDRTQGPISIQDALFNSYKGVLLQGTNTSMVRKNIFTIEHDPITPGNTEYPYGLYLDKAQAFNIEGNQFTGVGNTQTDGAAGLVIRNTGSNNNEFYRCDFDDMRLGSQALSWNRDGSNVFLGLKFRCNDYENGWNDADVREDMLSPSSNPSFTGMREMQGQNAGTFPTMPDNEFGNSSSILNFSIENQGNFMQYSFSGAASVANRYYPSIVTPNVLRLNYTQNEECPDRMLTWGMDRPFLVSRRDQVMPFMMVKLGDLEQYTDGGNTPQLLSAVQTANSTNVNTVYNDLMANSPYLSDEVLQTVASAGVPFTQVQVRDVLVANPHSARSRGVQVALDNRTTPLSQADRDLIYAQIGVSSDRDVLQSELAGLVGEYDATLHELLYNYTVDTMASLADYAHLYKHPNNPTYWYRLAERYFDAGDMTNYTQTVSEIPQVITLNSQQQSYHTAFTQLFGELNTWQLAGETVYGDLTKRDWLLAFADNHSSYPPRVNSYLAMHDTIIDPPNVYIDYVLTNEAFVSRKSENQLNTENEASTINMYPNPTKNKVTLEWKEEPKEATVTVYNTFGVKVYSEKWIENTPLSFDVGAWRQGAYFVLIQTDNKTIRRNLLIGR